MGISWIALETKKLSLLLLTIIHQLVLNMKNIIIICFFLSTSFVVSTQAGLTKRFLLDTLQDFIQPVDDFSESRKGYEFVYHDSHDLLLVLTNETCVFVNSLDNEQWALGSYTKNLTEDFVINVIKNGTVVKNTTIDLMRAKYSDVLANYRCNGKRISEFDIHETTYGSHQGGSTDYCKWFPYYHGCQHHRHHRRQQLSDSRDGFNHQETDKGLVTLW